MTRPGNEQTFSFESLALSVEEPTEVSDLLKFDFTVFNNFHQKHLMTNSWPNTDYWENLQKYALMINQEGDVLTLETVSEDKIGGNEVFIFAFCTRWQKCVFLKFSSILFLDSTNQTSFSLEDSQWKVFLYTILVRHDAADCGKPVAFMVTYSESQSALTKWLSWLEIGLKMSNSPTFIIDFSATEQASIRTVLPSLEI